MQLQLITDPQQYEKGQQQIPQEDRSFLQSFDYGLLQKEIGNQPFWLIAKGDGVVLKSWLFILFRAKRGTYLFCPYGIFSSEELQKIVAFWKKRSKNNQRLDFLRISPLVDDANENFKIYQENGFKPAPVHMMHPELDWRLNIDLDEKKLLAGMRKNNRYSINKAIKEGVEVIEGVDQKMLDDFYNLHLETAKRHGFVPWSKSFLDCQLKLFAPKNEVKIYLAYYQNKLIAGAIIMFYEGRAYYHHGASDEAYSKVPASYLIQWKAILEAKKRGFKEYSFYGVVDNAPKHPWAGLSFFKKGFGGYGKPLLHCQDLPLTPLYWLNYWVEKIRRWKRGY